MYQTWKNIFFFFKIQVSSKFYGVDWLLEWTL